MSELVAVPRTAWVETRGQKRKPIPPEIERSMEETYQDGTCIELVIDGPKDPGTRQFVNLCKLYAERQGKRAVTQFDTNDEGQHILRYYMADVQKRQR